MNAKLNDSLKQTEEAKKQAIKEKDKATQNAQLFSSAMQARSRGGNARPMCNWKEAELLQRDTDAKEDPATIDRDRKELEAARKSSQELSCRCSAQVGASLRHHGSGPHHRHEPNQPL